MSKTHRLKTNPEFFILVDSGKKPFEVRLNDRDYQAGDILVLQEYDPNTQEYTGREITRKVTYILDDERFCKPGYVIMALSATTQHD